LPFVSKKATHPPLPILTVAALLPRAWGKKLVDMNVTTLSDSDLEWADLVFISAAPVFIYDICYRRNRKALRESINKVVARCKRAGVRVVACGPLFADGEEIFEGIDHFVLDEPEVTLGPFLEDLKNGSAKPIYASDERADMTGTPAPLWQLADMKRYAAMNIEYSRGCPFNCEFCNVGLLRGCASRTKNKEQIVAELESLYRLGWRGEVFFVDDNFLGNKMKLKREILPAIIQWMQMRRYPFSFGTDTSIELSGDEELIQLMVKAGFDTVLIGFETPNEESLAECNKHQNRNRDLIACVKKIQRCGLHVRGSFIVGFDNDPSSIFERQIEFVQESGVVVALVSILTALPGTRLYHRLEREGRLSVDVAGGNGGRLTNIIPKMNYEALVNGYKKILSTIYSPPDYYERIREFLKEYKPSRGLRIRYRHIRALLKSVVRLGIIGGERRHFWKLIFWSLFRRPRSFPRAVTLAIYGFHFRKFYEGFLR